MKRHLVLVGLPGSGKSTVGRLVAAELRVGLHDIDKTIADESGLSIADFFATRGEADFRRLERLATVAAFEGEPAVVVPGGGWAAQPGNMESVTGRATTVYLETAVATALSRLSGGETRPLLLGSDPTAALHSMFVSRKPWYERCDYCVSTDGKSAEQVAIEVAELARKCMSL
ncbi:MAG: shikimate kinase [Gemmatimonadota bacterium]|nr:MAG: shikimate kinase [Gemmatimonadota bacterium]